MSALRSAREILLRLPASLLRSCALARRWKLYAGASRLGEADCDGLLRRSRPVLAFADVFDLFAHKFSRLRRRRFAFSPVFARPFNGSLFWHCIIDFDVSGLGGRG